MHSFFGTIFFEPIAVGCVCTRIKPGEANLSGGRSAWEQVVLVVLASCAVSRYSAARDQLLNKAES
ncbi:hypothetical protein [Hydrogenophaga sp. PAMC20947]|uniref:hypothetical protein n=1 Tax=Hydrogenophaga sp. PAMC20947 TaxID=2565558 RepID=UPI00109DBBF3|nr:hypothetical protein [Hydrogenophaga sp. PAMC20947]QCB47093.1 hypothetical protein E5678_14305 [Hydrogenophaga sp. PAMC20947]